MKTYFANITVSNDYQIQITVDDNVTVEEVVEKLENGEGFINDEQEEYIQVSSLWDSDGRQIALTKEM